MDAGGAGTRNHFQHYCIMNEAENATRAEHARKAIDIHQKVSKADTFDVDPESAIRDLLTNLMHLCDVHGMSFDKAVEMSRSHHYAETTELA